MLLQTVMILTKLVRTIYHDKEKKDRILCVLDELPSDVICGLLDVAGC